MHKNYATELQGLMSVATVLNKIKYGK